MRQQLAERVALSVGLHNDERVELAQCECVAIGVGISDRVRDKLAESFSVRVSDELAIRDGVAITVGVIYRHDIWSIVDLTVTVD